jgi:NAD(P)H dehydrogenase (quinone)
MVVLGLPYQQSELMSTDAGGTPYGPSHVAHRGDTAPLTAAERTLAVAMGRRLAQTALKLAA